jgi:hypothetical protein
MSSPSTTPPSTPPPVPPADQTDFDIAEEYGTARKSLPPAGIVAICLGIVAIIVAAYALTHRATAKSSGSIDNVVAVPMPGQDMVMVAVNISLQNNEQKPAWIHTIQATADVGGTKHTDDAAPATDVKRYFQVFPALNEHASMLLTSETRVDPGSKVAGTIVVTFPVTADAFAARKSLTVTVTPYDELPVVMTK